MTDESFIRELTNERSQCPTCAGTGHAEDELMCPDCGGTGTISGSRPLRSIPSALLVGALLTAAGVAIVMLLMFLLSHG